MKEVKHYAVRIHGGPKGSGDGSRASIHLFDKGNRMIGHISFKDNGLALNRDKEENAVVSMDMPAANLTDVVDLLRNEGPIYIDWQSTLKNAYLGTAQEPVGEGKSIGFS